MNLPDPPRVIYNKTSLREVICQFRFPTILKIGTSEPADFQEKIRDRFPLYSLREELGTIGIPEQLRQAFPLNAKKIYDFLDEDKNTRVSLSQDFLALSTQDYGRFEIFMEKVVLALNALNELYTPNFYSRIGLRYADVINRDLLDIRDKKWSDLLEGCFGGELGSILSDVITETATNTLYVFDWGFLRCQHGLRESEEEGKCYYIDNDFFKEERISFQDIQQLLRSFNEYERKFLRHCISDRLHEAMEPTEP